MEQDQHEFQCVACSGIDKFPSFATFKQVCEHSSEVHGVRLESVVQSSTLLPEKLDMYLCRLCTPHTREVFQCKALVKKHLETHSTFFLKKWEEFIEIQCRVCEDVIDIEDLEQHVDEFHPRNLFADVKEAINPNSPANQDHHLSQLSSMSPNRRKSHPLPCTPSFSVEPEKAQSLQSSQPASEENLLWDHCFQPEQLINKYFSKLAPARTVKDSSTPTPSPTVQTSKPLIRVKPLSLLLAQSQQAEASPLSPISGTNIASPRSEPHISTVKTSPNRAIKGEINNESFPVPYVKQSTSLDDVSQIECKRKKYPSLPNSQSSHRLISPAPSIPDKSSPVRELPQYSGWLSLRPKQSQDLQRSSYSRNSMNNVPKDDCLVCGMQVARLHRHISSEHQDMLFMCKLGGCRSRKVGYLYPNQLDRHHSEYHNLSRISWGWLDTSRDVTGLPASLVKITCPINKCSHFVLSSNSSLMDKHLWSAHHLENVTPKYLCRVCLKAFPSLDDVVEHSRDHMRDRCQLKTDMEKRDQEFGRISSSNREGRRRSPLSYSRQSLERRSRSPNNKRKRSPSRESTRSRSRKSRRSLSRKSRRSPSWKSRRSPSRKSMTSPSRKSRRSSSRKSRRSPRRKSRRSPSRKSLRSLSRESRRSSSWKSRRSLSRKSKRSPIKNKRSVSKKRIRSSSRKSRTSPCVKSRGSAKSFGRKRIISPSRSSSRNRSCSSQSRRSPSRKKMRFQDGDLKRSPDSRRSSSRPSRILSSIGPSRGYNLISGGPGRSRCGSGSPGSSTQFYSYQPSGRYGDHN